MENNRGLTPRQLGLLLWAAMLAPLVRQAPGAMLPAAGRGAWLSALLTLPAVGLLSVLAGALLRARQPGEAPAALLCRILGRGMGRGIWALSGLWLCFCAGFTLRAGADRLVAAVYPESPPGLFAGLMLLLCLPAALGELRPLGRMAELCAPLLGVLFLSVSALALGSADLGSLLPEGAGPEKIAAGTVPLLGTLSAGGFFLLLWGTEGAQAPGGLLFWPLAGLSLTALGLCAVVTGTFGPDLAGEMDYPFFVMLRNIQLPHLLERGEALVAAAWVISDYLLLSAQLQMASRALTAGFRGPEEQRRPRAVWLAAALAALGAVLCARDAFALQRLDRRLLPLADLAFGFALLPVVLLIGKLRKKI